MARRNFKRQHVDGFFQCADGERSMRLPDSMTASDAWFCLSTDARDVLRDWLDQYFALSGWERRAHEIVATGMTYTWAHCRVCISERRFLAARKLIEKLGFFESPKELQRDDPGGAIRFRPSSEWRTKEATQERQEFETAKRTRISASRDKRRRLLNAIEEAHRERQKPTTNLMVTDTTNLMVTDTKKGKCNHQKRGVTTGKQSRCNHRNRGVLLTSPGASPSVSVHDLVLRENAAASLTPWPLPNLLSICPALRGAAHAVN